MIPDPIHPSRRRPAVAPFEPLESRMLLSATAVATPALEVAPAAAAAAAAAAGTSAVQGFTPAQISHAYGFDQIKYGSVTGSGQGQTIAIVDAYNDPNIAADLVAFDAKFGISDPPSFKVVGQTGSTTSLPATDAGWSQEISLDVEWAHAMAPQAKILLVEANSAGTSDLLAAVNYARSARGVSAVSMSWGSSEFYGQAAYDGTFTTPAGHRGVTFLAASGDGGSWWGPNWPSSSANVVAVGGTSLKTSASGAYGSERAWSGSGGGVSSFTAEPSYQTAVQSTGARATPDVSLDADPNTGYAVYDSLAYQGASGWMVIGGTSAATPVWSALVVIGDQGRHLSGGHALDGATGTLPLLYGLYNKASTYFHDVVSGMTSFFVSAGAGYDAATGLGTPKANDVAAAFVAADAAALAAAAAGQTTAAAAAAAAAMTATAAAAQARAAVPNLQPAQVQRSTSVGGDVSAPALAATDDALLASASTSPAMPRLGIAAERFGAEGAEGSVRESIARSSYAPAAPAHGSAAWWLQRAPETPTTTLLTRAWSSRNREAPAEPTSLATADAAEATADSQRSSAAGLADAGSFVPGAAVAAAAADIAGDGGRRTALAAFLGFAAVMTGCWAVAVRRQLRAAGGGAAGGSPFHDDAFIDVPPRG